MTFLGDVQNTNIEDIEKSESHESRANKHIYTVSKINL